MLLNAVLLLAVVSEAGLKAAVLYWGQARLITDHLDMLTKYILIPLIGMPVRRRRSRRRVRRGRELAG